MKKASLPLNYVFIIFISLIAVFVIVGMLSNWAFSSQKFMCKLTGDCDESGLIDKQTIEVDNYDRFRNEIIKHVKLCNEYARTGDTLGELCYTIKCNGCTASCSNVDTELNNFLGAARFDCSGFQSSNKAIIKYDASADMIVIE